MSTFNEHRIVIFTDFSATMDLRAKEANNCSEDNHAVLDIFLVFHNARKYTVQDKNGSFQKIQLNDCDSFGYFASSQSKGKKNDHIMHNKYW